MHSSDRFARRHLVVAALVAILALVTAAAPYREFLFRAIGYVLVVSDPILPSDVVAITLDSGTAGALEAADLLRAGIAPRIVVFAEPLRRGNVEFKRRGLPIADASTRQAEQLALLGIRDVVRIPSSDASGTHAEANVLANWCREHQLRSVILITTADHSRRLRRVMTRSLEKVGVTVAVRPASFSDFDPGNWWKTTDGRRVAVVEMQKLLLDVLTAPLQ